jgi:RHS repeat-associated protein
MDPLRGRPRYAHWLIAVAAVTAGMLTGALLNGVPALAEPPSAPPRPDPGHAVAGVKPVPSRFTKAADRAVGVFTPTATTFPAASSVSLDLPAKPAASRHAARAQAVGTPVWAQPVPDARGRYGGPARVNVRVLDHASALAAGVTGVLLTVAPGGSGTGTVRLGVDYSGFAQAYGGNFGARLRLVELPSCVLDTPRLAACHTATPLAAANDPATKTLSAPVALDPGARGTAISPMVLAATSDPGQEGGSAGSYAATTLKPSGSWTAGGSTGSFSYGYPIAIPPAPSPLVPRAALSYDSAGPDGQTASTQAQSSWVGDGWSTPHSFVEQSFLSCADKPEGVASPVSTSDMCYNGPILTLSLNGSSSSLVWDATKQVWKPQDDHGELVTHVTNSGNGSGTYNTDYWKVTDRSGTVYQFGRNQLPGWTAGKPTSDSVDSEPVYSSHAGDPCYSGAGFAASVCTMAYRWNLDYVTDVHGNAMSYYYLRDTNYYGQNNGAQMASYVRDSHLDHVDYGFTDPNAYGTAPNRISFNTGPRCVSGTCTPLNATTKANWPDVPFDLICAANTTCTATGPSFFSTVRLTSITAQQYSTVTSSYQTVDSYALTQSMPPTGDGTSPTLWLDSVAHTGSGVSPGGPTTPITLPPVVFGKAQLPNRVDNVTDGLPAFYRYRIASVTTETGSVISPTYQLVNPCSAPVTINPATNTSSCYPVSWTPPGYTAPFTDWFNKYVVSKVTATDPTGGAPATATSYVFADHGAAWHYDDNELVQPKYRTYGQFRGYSNVITLTGDGANDPQAKTETTYYRGMSRNNNTTAVALTDSAGGQHDDADELAGQPLETTTRLGNGGPVDHSTITSYWVSAATATRSRTGLPSLTAKWTAPVETYTRQAVTTGGSTTWRYTETDTSYDATVTNTTVGLPLRTYTHTVPADPKYDQCTGTVYATANTASNLVGLVSETESDSVACGGFTEGAPASVPTGLNTLTTPAAVSRPAQVVSDTRTFYDDPTFATTFPQPAAPAKGDPTMVRKADDWSGGAFTYQTATRTGYDSVGRVNTSYDGNSNRKTIGYTANPVGLVTGVSVTNPLNQASSITMDPQRGLALATTDLNGIVATHEYDPLGRLISVWLNSRSTSLAANYKYSYQISNTGVTAVTTNRLTDLGAYRTTVVLYDAQLRTRQTQTMTPMSGRMVTDTFYDSRGWVRAKYNGWWDANTLPTVGNPVAPTDVSPVSPVPNQDFLSYDGLGRVVTDTSEDSGRIIATTTTVYNGDRTTTIPPTGGITQATVIDPLGRTTELDQYTSAPTVNQPANTFTGIWSVSGGTTAATRYGYDGRGNQNTVTDAQNASWTSTFNLLGQAVARTDPDAGTSSMKYDGDGNPVEVTDSRGKTVSTTYDALNRKTGLYAAPVTGQTAANQLSGWVYDNSNGVAGVTNPIGHLTTQTAYWDSAAYTTQFKAFNVFGESLGETVTIPSAEGPVLGTSYAFTHTYTSTNGLLQKDIYPAAGGLPAETVFHTYTSDDRPNAIGSGYGYKTDYDAWGRVSQETIGSSPSLTDVTNTYDQHTGQLTDQIVSRRIATPTSVDHESYRYDLAGNLTRQVSTRLGATTPTETQCYAYDPLRRMAGAWTATDNCATAPTAADHAMVGDSLGAASVYWTTWSFDALGNRTNQTEHSTSGGTDTTTGYTYNGNGAGQPHTLTATNTAGGATATTGYGYDSSGRMTTRNAGSGNQILIWDDPGRLVTITGSTGGTSSFKYSPDGSLLIQKDPATTTLYLPGEQIVLNNSTGTTTGTRYQTLPGGVIVVRTGTGTTAYQFEIVDQHMTPVLYLDSTAQNPTWRQTTPYGKPRGAGATWPDNHGFLNKPTNTNTGLIEVGARKYDPGSGRFISVDPVFQKDDPQQLNGYSYAGNNPTSNSDPTGMRPVCGEDDRPHPCAVGEEGWYPPGSPAQNQGAGMFGPAPAGDTRTVIKTKITAPGHGIVVIKLFISDARFYAGTGQGDGRDFSLDPNASFRVAIAWNTDTGDISITVQPSCTGVTGCSPPLKINLSDTDLEHHNNVHVSGGDGTLNLRLDVQDAVTDLLPHIDQDISVSFKDNHSTVSIKGDPYPDFEVNQYTNDGGADFLARAPHMNSWPRDPITSGGGPMIHLLPTAPRRELTWVDGVLVDGPSGDLGTRVTDLRSLWCREEPTSPECFAGN